MGSGLDVKIFLLLQAAGVEQGVASSGWCFLPPLVQSLSDRFLMRHRIPLRIDFYVRQRVFNFLSHEKGSPEPTTSQKCYLGASVTRCRRLLARISHTQSTAATTSSGVLHRLCCTTRKVRLEDTEMWIRLCYAVALLDLAKLREKLGSGVHPSGVFSLVLSIRRGRTGFLR